MLITKFIKSSSYSVETFDFSITPSKYLVNIDKVRLTRFPTVFAKSVLYLVINKSSLKVPKVALGIKIHNKDLGKYYPLDLDLYLSMITTICFGSSSMFREKARNKKLISNFYTEWESVDKMHVFYIMASSENPDELLEEIKNEFNNLKINEDDFKRIKKVWIANEVKMIDDIDSTVHNIYDDFLKYKTIIPNKIERIRNLDINVLRDLIGKIDFNNMAVVKMLPEETD